MSQSKLLVRVREIVAKLEQRQALIASWIVHEDQDLVLLGTYQKQVVDEYHDLLIELLAEVQAALAKSE